MAEQPCGADGRNTAAFANALHNRAALGRCSHGYMSLGNEMLKECMKTSKRIIKLICIVFAIMAIFGCATLTDRGALVRVANQPGQVDGCEYLGQIKTVSGWGGLLMTGIGFDQAFAELKNKAAKLGGNVVVTQIISNPFGGTRMVGDVYLCPDLPHDNPFNSTD